MEVVGACPPFATPSRHPRSETLGHIEDRDTWTHMEKWLLVDVVLIGGAPWGFTLRGGLEYQEPLIITKVEEGSRAASAQLQVGDEIVSINAVPLSGYRQEAICLVKSSFKTLALGLKRKNEPLSKPQVYETGNTALLKPAWQTKLDAGSSAKDFNGCWDKTHLQHLSCQLSSLGNMKLLKPSSNTHPIGAENSATMRGGDKHNFGYRAFSSCTPKQHSSENTSSSACMFYQGSQSEHHRYLQIPVHNEACISPNIVDQPVWHVPETSSAAYLSTSQDPPLRNESFAANKVHEKGLGIPYSHGHPAQFHQKSHSRVADRPANHYQGLQAQHGYIPPSKNDFLQSHLSAKDHCPNKLNTTLLYSLSSTDIRQGQNHFCCQPQHQRQRSDESPFYLYPRNSFAPKRQSDGIYYRSLQTLPTNVGIQKQTRSATGSLSSTAFNNSSDGMGNYRYYCITSEESTQKVIDEETIHAVSDRNPEKNKRTTILKYPLTSLQASENEALSLATVNSNYVKQEKNYPQRKDENQHSNSRVHNQAEEYSSTKERKDTQNSNWISKNGHKICPQMTPLLHSLAQENMILTNSIMIPTRGCTLQEKPKQGRRSDRYATILLNEIQEKKAQLQKSRSAATLNHKEGFEEKLGVWKPTETSTSSLDGSFTSTYKDHLKAAQARVLQATSFQRRDLELPNNETFRGQLITKSTNGHDFLIVSRKKKLALDHSFSEPDKINEMGVEDKALQQCSFVDRFKFFERASKPIFSKPIPKKFQLNPSEDISERNNRLALVLDKNKRKSLTKQQFSLNKCYATAEEQQRLGTFAEYEASWNLRRKSVGGRTYSRYHSAENILDSGTEKGNSTLCVHERSRSSPSADFYGKKISLSAEKPWVATPPEHTLDPEKIQNESTSEKGQKQLNISEPVEFSRRKVLELRDVTRLLHATHITNGSCSASSDPHHLRFQDSVLNLSSSNKGTGTQKLGGHNEYKSTEQETTSSSCSNLMENTMEPSSAVQNIPMRIVQADSSSDTQTKHYLIPKDSLGCTDKGFTHRLSLCSSEQPTSLSQEMQFSFLEVQKMDSTETVKLNAAPGGLSEEDEVREELIRDIMGLDKSLVDILDQSKMKTTMDLMEGIYPQGEQLLEGLQQRRKSPLKQSPKTTQEKANDKIAVPASLAMSSSYYSTSAPKAELLIKMKDMQERIIEQGSEDEIEYDLASKKQELIDSLSSKLQVLREARESLLEDMQDNSNLGEEVEATVQAVCKPNELDKFRMFVGDLDKVVSLLLSLSGRLARVENALNNPEEGFSAEEKHTLIEKRKLLIRQHEDAKELKENLDRREHLVYEILTSYLSEERLTDYQHFVKMKSAHIIEQRKLDDRIKLGEEQLKCLKDSMPLEQRLGF